MFGRLAIMGFANVRAGTRVLKRAGRSQAARLRTHGLGTAGLRQKGVRGGGKVRRCLRQGLPEDTDGNLCCGCGGRRHAGRGRQIQTAALRQARHGDSSRAEHLQGWLQGREGHVPRDAGVPTQEPLRRVSARQGRANDPHGQSDRLRPGEGCSAGADDEPPDDEPPDQLECDEPPNSFPDETACRGSDDESPDIMIVIKYGEY